LVAVATWDHRPTADELLQARLARGWEPTPTATRDGDLILGHAACRVRLPQTTDRGAAE
jgi:hypothetical protein